MLKYIRTKNRTNGVNPKNCPFEKQLEVKNNFIKTEFCFAEHRKEFLRNEITFVSNYESLKPFG